MRLTESRNRGGLVEDHRTRRLKAIARPPLLIACMALCAAGVSAAATDGSATVTLSPDRPSAASTLTVTANGPFPQVSGTLTSVTLTTQRGFATSPKSVAVLCGADQEQGDSCPDASKIGGGTAVVTVTGALGSFSGQDTITFTLYLGVPLQRGDIASVQITGTDSVLHQSAHAAGRLFKAAGGRLELLFDQLPKYSVPPGTKVTLDRLSFTAHAVRSTATRAGRRHRRVIHSLITNPPRCSGSWHVRLELTFSDGSSYRSTLSAACRDEPKRALVDAASAGVAASSRRS